MTDVLIKRGNLGTDMCAHRGKTMWTHWKKMTSPSQGERLQKKAALPISYSWTSSLQNCEKINFCY